MSQIPQHMIMQQQPQQQMAAPQFTLAGVQLHAHTRDAVQLIDQYGRRLATIYGINDVLPNLVGSILVRAINNLVQIEGPCPAPDQSYAPPEAFQQPRVLPNHTPPITPPYQAPQQEIAQQQVYATQPPQHPQQHPQQYQQQQGPNGGQVMPEGQFRQQFLEAPQQPQVFQPRNDAEAIRQQVTGAPPIGGIPGLG